MLCMRKQTKKSTDTQKKVTIAFGYSLFAITIITLIIFTIIPFGGLAFDPHTINHTNTIILLITLVAGAIGPTLISYFLGDRATHIRNKTSHHYNGVLFGIAAYWMTLFFDFTSIGTGIFSGIMQDNSLFFPIVNNAWPIVTTSIIMIIVALTYAKHQKNKSSVLEHRPYRIVLIGSFVAFIGFLLIGYASQNFNSDDTLLSVLSLLTPIIITIVAFAVLKSQSSKSVRLATSIVVMSIGAIASSLAGQIISSVVSPYYTSVMFVSQAIGIVVSLLFLWLIARKY
jgi:hypothetical protein